MELIWDWADEWEKDHTIITDGCENIPLSDFPPWWEDMVAMLAAKEGRLNLS